MSELVHHSDHCAQYRNVVYTSQPRQLCSGGEFYDTEPLAQAFQLTCVSAKVDSSSQSLVGADTSEDG